MGKDSPLKIVIGGMVALIVVMGIGRFAYTPILPLMQNARLFEEQVAGYLASANYFGYLLGAICAGIMKWRKGKQFYVSVYLLISFLTTITMGLTEHWIAWFTLRFISGFASGLVFVFASSIVMDALSMHMRFTWSGIFYSGVGIGIFISGLLIPIFHYYFNWQGAWIGIGVVACILSMVVILFLKEHPPSYVKEKTPVADGIRPSQNGRLRLFIAAYGCEGVGYIVSATFLVALIQEIPSLSGFPSISWILVGLAAAPSCFIWANLATKWGNMPTLQIAFFLQIIGVLLPIVFHNAAGALIGAFLFGATFMGITTLFMAEARSLVAMESSQVIGYLTFFYGIGQMIGPTVAGIFITNSGGYRSALIFAASVLICGMVLLSIVQVKIMIEKMKQKIIEKGMG